MVEALRADPARELDRVLPPARVEALRRRAAALGRPARTGHDVLRGEFADLLWEPIRREELLAPPAGRLAESAAAVRRLAEHVHGGGVLVIFPHGYNSPDGGIAPLDPRAVRLLARLQPTSLQAVGFAYDPLVRGRPRAFMAVGEPFAPGDDVLAALRLATPLTCGLVLARETVARGAAPDARAAEAAIAREVERAAADGRLSEPGITRARIAEALATARRRGPDDDAVRRAARTWKTVRLPRPSLPAESSSAA